MKIRMIVLGLLLAMVGFPAMAVDEWPELDIGGQVDDVQTKVATENDFLFTRITPYRAWHVNLRTQSGNEIGVSNNPVRVDPTGTTTQPVSATALPLPSGAATSALQTTGNTSLSSINTKTPTLDQKTMSGSSPVVIASDQSDINIKIVGNTNGTTIGNTGDRLKVDAQFSSVTTTVPSWSSNLKYIDMNASNGGVARNTSISTTYTNVFNYSGSGFLAGFIINLESFNEWTIKLAIDGVTSMEILTSDLTSDTIYDMDDVTDVNQVYLGLSKGSHDRFVFHAPLNSPIRYNYSITISVKKSGGAGKKFQAGIIILSKET